METLTEIFANPEIDPIPEAIRHGDLVTGFRIDGRDPVTGELGSTIREQLDLAYGNLRRCVEAAGGTTDHIAQVSFFLRDFDDRDLINEGWIRTFADPADRPTYKFMPAPLDGGRLVQLEFFAVPGERRHPIDLAGVAHTNPIPLAVRIGRYLFSSRLLPYDPATGRPAEGDEAQADRLFEHAAAVLSAAGLGWAEVVQGRAFSVEDRGRVLLASRWRARFAGTTAAPPLHAVRYGSGALRVMLELVAVAASTAGTGDDD
jgi:2-iminobutanoate/2-iminopropanoate deaminase